MIVQRLSWKRIIRRHIHHLNQWLTRAWHGTPIKVRALAFLFALLCGIESLPGFMAFAESPVADVAHPAAPRDPGERKRPSIVNSSSDGPTIHFTSCRENDKQHVSCSFVDADGKQHWVYLAGYKLPAAK